MQPHRDQSDAQVGSAHDLRRLTEDVVERCADADEVTFLGALFDHGLAWVHWPDGVGGLNAQPSDQRIVDDVLESAGRRPSWMRNPMGVGMVAPALVAHGTAAQRDRYLRPIFTAEEIWCQLFSEPGAGSDVATLATNAVLDGDEWIVNGQKVWTSSAHLADWGLLLARTDPELPKHNGITAFVLDMRSNGVDVRPMRMITGDAHFNEVFLTDVRIPDAQRVGCVNDGWRVAVTTLMNERVSIGGAIQPQGSGEIALALEAWRKHGGTLVQRDRLTRLWIEAEVVRLGNIRAEQLRSRGAPGPEGSVSKLASALLAQRITSFTVELLGAAGTLFPDRGDDMDLDRSNPAVAFLIAQSTTIAGGTSEIMRDILGQRVLGLPPEPRVDKGLAWKDIPQGV
jgi:alkylation response protein AidB-like acyl-CoA dehydrogenase